MLMILIIRFFWNLGIPHDNKNFEVNLMTINQAKSYKYLNEKIKPKKKTMKKEPPGKLMWQITIF